MNKFSIITPSLNQAHYLERAILSVINQAGDFYIEYIIADGDSSDDSVEIIKKYDELLKNNKYPRKCKGIKFKWWSEPDNGQTQALNRGFKNSSGEICAWINSDDYYVPGAFQRILNEFKNDPELDMVYGNVTEIYENGEIRKGESGPGDFAKNLKEGCQISQQGAFFTRRALETADYLDESYQYCMDYNLWLKILKTGKAVFIPNELAFFRIWPGSKTTKEKSKFKEEEDRIRKRYGGSLINPGAIHRWRYNQKWLEYVKKQFPVLYFAGKKIVYGIINILRHRND